MWLAKKYDYIWVIHSFHLSFPLLENILVCFCSARVKGCNCIGRISSKIELAFDRKIRRHGGQFGPSSRTSTANGRSISWSECNGSTAKAKPDGVKSALRRRNPLEQTHLTPSSPLALLCRTFLNRCYYCRHISQVGTRPGR
jgi:hypothetical protein